MLLAGRLLREAVLQQNALSAERRLLLRRQDGRARRRRARRRRRVRGAGRARGARQRDRGARLLRRCCARPRRPRRTTSPASASRRATDARHPGRYARSRPQPETSRVGLQVEYARDQRTARTTAGVAAARPASAGTSSRRSHRTGEVGSDAGEVSASAARTGAGGRPRPGRGAGSRGHRGAVPRTTRVAFSGRPLRIPGRTGLARAHLQRPRRADRRRPADPRRHHRTGVPATRSTRRIGTHPAEPVLTGVSAIDALHHPGPRPEAADLLRRRAAAPRARHPDRRPVDRG